MIQKTQSLHVPGALSVEFLLGYPEVGGGARGLLAGRVACAEWSVTRNMNTDVSARAGGMCIQCLDLLNIATMVRLNTYQMDIFRHKQQQNTTL